MRSKVPYSSSFLILIVISVIMFITQCVDEYHPDIDTKDNLLVVNGSILQGDE